MRDNLITIIVLILSSPLIILGLILFLLILPVLVIIELFNEDENTYNKWKE